MLVPLEVLRIERYSETASCLANVLQTLSDMVKCALEAMVVVLTTHVKGSSGTIGLGGGGSVGEGGSDGGGSGDGGGGGCAGGGGGLGGAAGGGGVVTIGMAKRMGIASATPIPAPRTRAMTQAKL